MPDATRTALLAGATGLVGSHCLSQLLSDPAYGRVVAVVRRPLPLNDPKLDTRVVDFDRLAGADLPPVDDVYCALGTTIRRAGSRDAFRHVDHDYVVALARRAAERGATRFVLVSAIGADARSLVFYNRVKGETERDVAAVSFAAVHLLRPSFLVGERSEHRPGERLMITVFSGVAPLLLGPLRRYRPVAAEVVARAMRAVARTGGTGIQVYESDRIAQLGERNTR
jgi:uncharacterized protein YbjT (DUF2867 family)